MEDFKKNALDQLNDINKRVNEMSDSLLKSLDAVAASINNINVNESTLCEKTQDTQREQKITECIENFDWDRIEKVMNYLNWQWFFNYGDNCHVPSIDEMQQRVTELFMDCYRNLDNSQEQSYTMSCGGFEVCVYKDNNECSLKFVCSEWNTIE